MTRILKDMNISSSEIRIMELTLGLNKLYNLLQGIVNKMEYITQNELELINYIYFQEVKRVKRILKKIEINIMNKYGVDLTL